MPPARTSSSVADPNVWLYWLVSTGLCPCVEAADAVEAVAAALRHDVDDAALEIVELGRRAHGFHLYFLHDVRAGEVTHAAVRHRGDVDTVVLELILIAARAEDDEARVVRHLIDLHRRCV